MTILDHALHTALPVGIGLKLAGVPMSITIPVMALAGLANAIPDLAGPVAGLLHPLDSDVEDEWLLGIRFPVRWDVYTAFHAGEAGGWWRWLWWPHVKVDELMHSPDGRWWPREWPIASVFWLVEVAAFTLFLIL